MLEDTKNDLVWTKKHFNTREEAWSFFQQKQSAVACLFDRRSNQWVVIYSENR